MVGVRIGAMLILTLCYKCVMILPSPIEHHQAVQNRRLDMTINDHKSQFLEGFIADYTREHRHKKLEHRRVDMIEERKASLKPSDFRGLLVCDSCPDPSDMDVRITCKYSLRNFRMGLRLIANRMGWAYTYLSQKLTWQIARDAQDSVVIGRLRELAKVSERLMVYCDDCRIDSLMQPGEKYSPGQLDHEYITVRILNEEVKSKLQVQAITCGIPAGLYVQVCMVKRVLEHSSSDPSRILGNTAKVWQMAVDRFDGWLQYRAEYLAFATSRLISTVQLAGDSTDCADLLPSLREFTIGEQADGDTVTRGGVVE